MWLAAIIAIKLICDRSDIYRQQVSDIYIFFRILEGIVFFIFFTIIWFIFFSHFFSYLIQERPQNAAPSDNGRVEIVNRPINKFYLSTRPHFNLNRTKAMDKGLLNVQAPCRVPEAPSLNPWTVWIESSHFLCSDWLREREHVTASPANQETHRVLKIDEGAWVQGKFDLRAQSTKRGRQSTQGVRRHTKKHQENRAY